MEVRGHIIPPGTYSPAGAPAGRLQELRERQRGLRQALGLRLRELRRLCLQEAELTGKLPPEYPLEPGERPQPPPRRRAGGPPRGPFPEPPDPHGGPPYPGVSHGGPHTPMDTPRVSHACLPTTMAAPVPCVSHSGTRTLAARAARREVAVQLQVVEAARRLAAAPGLPPEQRRRRQRLQAEAAQRLRQLRAQLGAAAHDENGSLCDLPALENGALPPPKPPPSGAGRPSPPGPDPAALTAGCPGPPTPPRGDPAAAAPSPALPARHGPCPAALPALRVAASRPPPSWPAAPAPAGTPSAAPRRQGCLPGPGRAARTRSWGGPRRPAPPRRPPAPAAATARRP
ncbi:coiled-coil domain-containing protein 120 [Sarcoramphus papa]